MMLFHESSVADDGAYKLIIRQEPAHARVAIGKDKGRSTRSISWAWLAWSAN